MGALFKWLAAASLACGVVSTAHGGPVVVEKPPADPGLIRWDPAIRHGVLPNGLRYAIMQNGTPRGGVSIRLAIDVGSLSEAADEQGIAHYLEHMAFGGSHAQLQSSVETAFAAAGVAFGRDRNAMTSLVDTTYKIDLPRGDAAGLDLGFRWLRQVADGAQLTQDAVDRERGVILAEREARLSDLSLAAQRVTAFQAPSASPSLIIPIGTPESIAGITPAKLQAFYDRWYQPINAVVVVVGDQPADEMEARVKATFASWRPATAPPPAKGSVARIDASRGLDAIALAAPNLPTSIGACRVSDAEVSPTHDMAALRRDMETAAWAKILYARVIAAAPGASLIGPTVLVTETRGGVRLACLTAAGAEGGWSPVLSLFGAQLKRLDASPPDEAELETALKGLRAEYRGELFGQSTRDSASLADSIDSALLEQRASPSPAEAMRTFDVAVADVTPADIQVAFRRDWAGSGPLLSVLAAQPPTADAVRQAWISAGGPSGSGPAPAPAARSAAAVWRYTDFGRPGRVTRRESLSLGDFTRVTYANGVRLNFKHTDFKKGQVIVRLVFGDGRRELAGRDMALGVTGASLFERGGLGRNSYDDINAIFDEWGLHVELRIGERAFVMRSTATADALESDLQLMAASVSDPGFKNLDAVLPVVVQSTVRGMRSSPAAMVRATLMEGLSSDYPAGPAGMTAVLSAKGTDLARVLDPALTGAPLEVTVIGDTDEKAVVDAVGETFGALPPRKETPRIRPDAWFLRFPSHPPPTLTGYHDGPPEKAAIALVWPLYVAEPARRREEYAIGMVARIYQEALLRRIRGDLGKAYSPAATIWTPDYTDQGYLIAEAQVARGDVDLAKAEMTGIAARIAQGGVGDEDLDAVRKPYLAQLAAAAQTNEWWAGALEGSSRDDTALRDSLAKQDAIASLTVAEVRKAAADWLGPAPIVVTVTARPGAAP